MVVGIGKTVCQMNHEKPIYWVGGSYKDLLSFPVGVKQEAGYQLHRVQKRRDRDISDYLCG